MREVGAFEAKTKLSELLDAVANGEEIIITRHGKVAAHLIAPPTDEAQRARVREAVRNIRELAGKMKLGKFDWQEWKAYRDEGRE